MDQDSADAGVMGRQEGNCWNQPGLETWTVQTPPPHALGHAVSWGGGDLARGAGCAPTLYSGLRRGWGDNLDIEHETTGLSLFAIPHDVPSAPGPWNLSLSQNWPCCTGLAEASMAAPNGFFFFFKRRSKPVAKAHANEHIPGRRSLLQSKGFRGMCLPGS